MLPLPVCIIKARGGEWGVRPLPYRKNTEKSASMDVSKVGYVALSPSKHGDVGPTSIRRAPRQQLLTSARRRVGPTSKRRRHDVVLNELHWLPMVQRVRFKLALIVFKCLHGLAPSYLTDHCVLVSSVAGRRPLRSADTRTPYVPRTRTAIGARNFAVAGPRVWNSLPPEL